MPLKYLFLLRLNNKQNNNNLLPNKKSNSHQNQPEQIMLNKSPSNQAERSKQIKAINLEVDEQQSQPSKTATKANG